MSAAAANLFRGKRSAAHLMAFYSLGVAATHAYQEGTRIDDGGLFLVAEIMVTDKLDIGTFEFSSFLLDDSTPKVRATLAAARAFCGRCPYLDGSVAFVAHSEGDEKEGSAK